MVGQILGHYCIDAKVSEGKFATVYKGRDVRLDRMVAIKVLKEESLQAGTTWGRLLKEARIASALNHPNVCTLYDIGEEQDTNYVVLEFVEGTTLRAILESGLLPTQSVLQYGMQIADALSHMHGAGILHEDLKSSNIMVTPAGRIKVLDFGLAKFIEEENSRQGDGSHPSVQETGWIAGTLPYLAPELLHGEAPTTQSGVWSLGVVLFEMLTGELPFAGRTSFELGMDIMTGSMRPLPGDVSGGLRGVVQRCLARDRECRYYSAVEVFNDLQSEFISFQIKSILAQPHYLQSQARRVGRLASTLMWFAFLFMGN